MKVFTKTHFDNLSQLIIEALFKDKTFYNNLNMPITVYDLVNNTTINSLTSMYSKALRKLNEVEQQNEWKETDTTELIKTTQLLNLLIGYKTYSNEVKERKEKRKLLEEKLNTLKEASKSPEEKIKEIEELIKSTSLNTDETFLV
ncbi:MAG: hypothetical protein MR840_02960 [Solobacterium sp.]|nr:hypothetical protein [Solobacterium sp.]